MISPNAATSTALIERADGPTPFRLPLRSGLDIGKTLRTTVPSTDPDREPISASVLEPNILITGGTGFFARGFVRAALDAGAKRVCIYSRGEYQQHLMRHEFRDDPRLRWFIGDVRDRERLRWAMQGIDLVVHAAALKRIETAHYNPTELVKTNVLGTMNVIEAAQSIGVRKVVGLSTDKAFQPVSAYGQSKAMAESLMLAANHTTGSRGPAFAVCRYGNIAGSTGSVIPTWRRCLEQGIKGTIAHPEVTRFWMTRHQAVALVMDTIHTMTGGELVIPELPAYRLGDLAVAMQVPVTLTQLGRFEKMHEAMSEGNSSDKARRMSIGELVEALAHV